MRKLFAGMMVCMLMLALTACGNAEDNHLGELSHSAQSTMEKPAAEAEREQESESGSGTEESTSSQGALETDSKPETEGIAKELVVYFSWSGNTQSIATEIQNQTGADVFRLMPVEPYTDDYDLSGKTIIPFVTSGGSGFSDTISTIKSMEPDAEVLDGLSLGSSQAAEPASAVTDWLNGLAE